jgi:hypothetical protein
MLIPVYHIIASQLPISSTLTLTAAGVNGNNFEPGHVVALDSSGNCVKNDLTNLAPVGLAADKNRPAVAYEWQNRLSDFGQETRASGLLSVYHSGGEFWVDMDDDTVQTPDGTNIDGVITSGSTVTPGTRLYGDATATTGYGHLSSTVTGVNIANVVGASQELPTGIPGEFEPGSTFAQDVDTDNKNFVKVKLLI